MPLARRDVIAREDLRPLGDALVRAGYDFAACVRAQTIGSKLGRASAELVSQSLSEPPEVAAMLRLFALGLGVEGAEVERVLGAGVVGQLERLGLLRAEGGRLIAEFTIIPHDEFYIACDFNPGMRGRGGTGLADDYVMGISPSTRTVGGLTPRRRVSKALDVGAGQGYLTMLASRHCDRVIATDVNERALSAAAVSIAVGAGPGEGGGVGRSIVKAEVRHGGMYDPVAGEGEFDLITSNPPFVIQPPTDRMCLSSSEGEDFVRRLMVEGASRLREGGYLTATLNWGHVREDEWATNVVEWTQDCGCDLWLMRFKVWPAEAYARHWVQEVVGGTGGKEVPDHAAWTRHLETLGYNYVSFGLAALRRRSGPNWARVEHVENARIGGSAGDQIERVFRNQTLMGTLGSGVLDLPLALAPGVELTRRWKATPAGAWQAAETNLTQSIGVPFESTLGGSAPDFVACVDGIRSARGIVDHLAKLHGFEPGPVLAKVTPLVESLLRNGSLEVVTPG